MLPLRRIFIHVIFLAIFFLVGTFVVLIRIIVLARSVLLSFFQFVRDRGGLR